MTTLGASYDHCVGVARARAKNFYYSFLVLPEEKRLAMCAIYAFMRECDDLSDEAGATQANLDRWRADLDQTLSGRPAPHPLWPAFHDVAHKYRIPPRYFHEMIDGVASDLQTRHVETFQDLYDYCYLVASVVGLTTIHIFGFQNPKAVQLAEKCGIAFQLTNIIRDVREDAGLGRLYLPAEDLRRFEVTSAHLQATETAPSLQALLTDLGARAQQYYTQSRPLIAMMDEDSQPALWALIEIYSRLLQRIQSSNYDVMPRRQALSTAEKLSILAQAWCRRLL